MKKKLAILILLSMCFILASCSRCLKHKDSNVDNVCDKCGRIINNNANKEVKAPKNIKYDENTRILSWDKVDNAKEYIVEIMFDDKIVFNKYLNENYVTIDATDLFNTFFVGDKFEIFVTATGENSSKTTNYEHILQQDFYYTDFLVDKVTKNHNDENYENVSSIDFLDFSEGIAIGKINHIVKNIKYFTFFIKKDENIKKVNNYEDFFNNFLVETHGNNEYTRGSLFENEYVKEFIIKKIEIDINQYKEIFVFKDWNFDRTKYFSLCAITNDGKYEFYGLGNDRFIGSENYMIGKMKSAPESFYVNKYMEFDANTESYFYLDQLNKKLSEKNVNVEE